MGKGNQPGGGRGDGNHGRQAGRSGGGRSFDPMAWRAAGEPLPLEPAPAALFTPEQMKRLDEWTEEAPPINSIGAGGSRERFETFIERSNEDLLEERELVLAAQQLAC